jgi:hypothetical protein
MTLEHDIEAQFLSYIGGGFVLPLKMNLQGNRGWPDRLIILPNGRVCWVEMKRPGGKATRLQLARHKALKEMGHAVGIFDDATEAAYFVAYEWRKAVASSRIPKDRRQVASQAPRGGAAVRSRAWEKRDLVDRVRCAQESRRRKEDAHRRPASSRSHGVDA